MTKAEIDAVLDRVRTWPHARQEDAAAALLRLQSDEGQIYELSEEEERALDEAEAEGDAPQAEVEAFFARYLR